MSETDKTPETAACRKSSDMRTFCIALLTAIVVVAAYHVGTRLCRMFCGAPGGCGKPAVTYMLVPVFGSPVGCPMMRGGCPMREMSCYPGKFERGHHPGKFERGHHPGRHFRKPGEGGPAMRCKKGPKAIPAEVKQAPAGVAETTKPELPKATVEAGTAPAPAAAK